MRKISESEKIYHRVKDFIKILPSDVLASIRIHLSNPKEIDFLIKKIRKEIGLTSIRHKDGWSHCFWYGEKEFNELMRQLI
jgi:hypothetical protein